MKILAITDIHGSYHQLMHIVDNESPDVIINGGDLTSVGTIKEVEKVIGELSNYCEKIFCISGNMDLPAHDELYSRLGVSINGCGTIHNDLGIFGVSASPYSHLRTPYEISEDEIASRIKSGYSMIAKAPQKILVTHTPPFGTKTDIIHSSVHVGSMAVRDFIEEKQPDIVICGHIHEARGQDKIENTHIINCGPVLNGYYAVIEIGNGKTKIKNLQLKFRAQH